MIKTCNVVISSKLVYNYLLLVRIPIKLFSIQSLLMKTDFRLFNDNNVKYNHSIS